MIRYRKKSPMPAMPKIAKRKSNRMLELCRLYVVARPSARRVDVEIQFPIRHRNKWEIQQRKEIAAKCGKMPPNCPPYQHRSSSSFPSCHMSRSFPSIPTLCPIAHPDVHESITKETRKRKTYDRKNAHWKKGKFKRSLATLCCKNQSNQEKTNQKMRKTQTRLGPQQP